MYAKELQTGHHLNWYDYGARFYDPAIGRWSTPDPLMEWHFNNGPYNYVQNNPLLFIDPFGLESDSTNNVLPDGTPLFNIGEVLFKINRPSWIKNIFRKLRRFFKAADKDGQGETQTGGLPLISEEGGASPTKTKAENTEEAVNIDLLLAVDPSSGPFIFRQKLASAIALQKAGDAICYTKLISDKEILKEHTGNGEKITEKKLKRMLKNRKIQSFIVPTHKHFKYKTGPSYFDESYVDDITDTLFLYYDSIYYTPKK